MASVELQSMVGDGGKGGKEGAINGSTNNDEKLSSPASVPPSSSSSSPPNSPILEEKEGEGSSSGGKKERGRDDLKKSYQTDCHSLPLNELEKRFFTSTVHGLSKLQYDKNKEQYGLNELTPAKKTPAIIKWLKSCFTGLFNLMLWGGGILCFVAYGIDPNKDISNLYLGVVLCIVVLLTGTFAFYQESSSSAIMEGFKKFLPAVVSVVRDGKATTTRAEHLVPGDVIKLKMGDKVPADIRIIECTTDTRVDNSSLTGESEPIERSSEAEHPDVFEAKNVCFFGTQLVQGHCTGLVFNTADRTFMGRIASLADETAQVETPLHKEIEHFVRLISAFAVSIGVLFFIIGLIIGRKWIENIVFAIGIIVANVPEGLLATVTVALTLTAKRMAAKNVLVKNLEAVETLGSTSCICSDKTGTLTMNVMTVAHVFYDFSIFECNTHNALEGKFDTKSPSFQHLLRIACLCNNTNYEIGVDENGKELKELKGDASEKGITRFIEPHFHNRYEDYRAQHERFFGIPFNSANKWQLSVHQLPASHTAAGANLLTIPDPKKTTQPKYNPWLYLRFKKPDYLRRQSLVGRLAGRKKILQPIYGKTKPGELPQLGDADTTRTYNPAAHSNTVNQHKTNDNDMNALMVPTNGETTNNTSSAAASSNSALMDKLLERAKAIEEAQRKAPSHVASSATFAPLASRMNDHSFGGGGKTSLADMKKAFEQTMTAPTPQEINVLHHQPILVVKGAPEQIISYCDRYMLQGKVYPMTAETKEQINRGISELSEMGERVLGFAELRLDPNDYTPNFEYSGTTIDTVNLPMKQKGRQGLVFVGLIAMIDPPRIGVPEAVEICKEAGIKVIMVTGDHPTTAKAIARKVGIIELETKEDVAKRTGRSIADITEEEYDAIVVTGFQLTDLENESEDTKDKFWRHVLSKKNIVFARTSPQQKLLIVAANQKQGHVVAVTGDGVNDAPALKKADIGVAMGIAGTEVAKDAADMILLDDNFASIVHGVEEGRIIFDNLRKTIAYILTSNVPELIPYLAFIVFSIPLPLTTVLILCIDLGTDMIPAISFAQEAKESDIMLRAPRNPIKDHLCDGRIIGYSYGQLGMFETIMGFYAYLVIFIEYGIPFQALYKIDDKGNWDESDLVLYCATQQCRYINTNEIPNAKSLLPSDFDINRPFDHEYRKEILGYAQSAFWTAIVIAQLAMLLLIRTRNMSIFQKEFPNNFMIFGIFFEFALAVFLLYVPPVASVFGTKPLEFRHWLISLPFWTFMIGYDEVRKWVRRNYPGCWMDKVTFY